MKRSAILPLLLLALCINTPLHAYDNGDAGVECENTLMNDIHSEVIYELSGEIVEINNEIIQAEIAKINTIEAPKVELIESIDSITELSNELVEQQEAILESHPKKSFFQRARDHIASTSKTLIAFGKAAFGVTKEKSIQAGTFIAQESKKAFGFLKNKFNFLLGKVEDKKEEIKKNKADQIAEYKNFELTEKSFETHDRTYTSKILRDQNLQQLMTPKNQTEKVLIYKFEEDRLYHLGSDGKKSRLHLLTLRTITLKDLSQITLESNFIKNDQIKGQIIAEKKQLEYNLDKVNRKLLTNPSSAEHLISAHRIGQAIVDLKNKMHQLKNEAPEVKLDQDIKLDNQIAVYRRRVKKGSEEMKTQDGEIITVYDVEL